MAKKRNNIIELGRFIYSLIVVGYHIQLSYDLESKEADPFECGALAVEYYFFLSGYFLVRSLEKLSTDEQTSFLRKYYNFMKSKIVSLLNVHFIAIIAVIIIIACCDTENFVDKFVPGITSIFLVQMVVVYHGDFEKALIVPEWYLSSMIICMLIMVPIFLLFKKIIANGIYIVLILLGVLIIFAIIFGLVTNWNLKKNMIFDMRAWGEMNLSMFSYYLSLYVGKQTYGECMNIFLKVVEIIGYGAPVILGIIPMKKANESYCMTVTGACAFCAIFITFSNKGNIIQSDKVNYIFGYLGSVSLPIYVFHPVIIILVDYVYTTCPKYAKHLIIFSSSLILAFAYRLIADYLNKKIEERNQKKKEESEKLKEEIKDEIKNENEGAQEVIANNKEEDNNNNVLIIEKSN